MSPPAPNGTPVSAGPSWVNEYLLGVAAECDLESEYPAHPAADDLRNKRATNRGPVVRNLLDRTRRG